MKGAASGIDMQRQLFFKIVAGAAEEGAVSIDRFVEGCMQMKGAASGIDMQRQLFEMHLLHNDLKAFASNNAKVFQSMQSSLNILKRTCTQIASRPPQSQLPNATC